MMFQTISWKLVVRLQVYINIHDRPSLCNVFVFTYIDIVAIDDKKGTQLDSEELDVVRALHYEAMSQREIAHYVNRSNTAICSLVNGFLIAVSVKKAGATPKVSRRVRSSCHAKGSHWRVFSARAPPAFRVASYCTTHSTNTIQFGVLFIRTTIQGS